MGDMTRDKFNQCHRHNLSQISWRYLTVSESCVSSHYFPPVCQEEEQGMFLCNAVDTELSCAGIPVVKLAVELVALREMLVEEHLIPQPPSGAFAVFWNSADLNVVEPPVELLRRLSTLRISHLSEKG